MKKKTKVSSSMEKKKMNKTLANNRKDNQPKPKPTLNKSVEKKRKIGLNLPTESGISNSTIEIKSQKDRIHLTKQRKNKSGSQKAINSRSAKSNKNKEYENTLNKLTEDNEKEKEEKKEYDFINYKNNDSSTKKSKEKEKNKKSPNYNNEDNSKKKKNKLVSFQEDKKGEEKNKKKVKVKLYEDNEEESDEEEKDDFIHRTFYRTSLDNKGLNNEKYKSPNIRDDKDKDKSKDKKIKEQSNKQSNDKYSISMEKTDDIRYNNEDKKIYSNINDKQRNYKTEYNNDSNEKSNGDIYHKYEKRNIYSPNIANQFNKLIDERTIDLFVIDGDDDIVVSTKNKKKIDRKRNKFKEIYIEKYDSETPVRNDKLTGFVLIRKNNGKKVYDLHLEDDIDKINSIFKNKEVMINNELLQIIPLKKLIHYQNELKNNDDKIYKLQSDLNKKESNKEKDKDKETEKLKEKDRQIANLRAKNDELNNLAKSQEQQINQNEKELKQIKSSYEKLKEQYQLLEKEKKSLVEQAESYKLKKKVVQFQLDEKNDQKNIKEMKERIKKYKDELRKVPPPEARHRLSFSKIEDPDLLIKEAQNTKKQHKGSLYFSQGNDNKVNHLPKKEEEDDDEEDDIDMGVEGGDLKAKKMKNAVNRFKKKYHDVIKEEKKISRMKEKEEKEKNEEKELENDSNYDNNEEFIRKQKEEEEMKMREKIEIERRENEERERKEREERERKEREEREKKEREEREKKEREEREKKEREEREKKERERKEKEERERKEREKKEKEKREREEKERKEKEERERKEREKKEKEKREREEKERKEKEKRDKEEKERKEKEKKDKAVMGGAKPIGPPPCQNKMMGGNFAKMLADKLKMPPGGGMGMGMKKGQRNSVSKPPIIENNVNVVQLLEEQPFKGRRDKRKPTRKVFVEDK